MGQYHILVNLSRKEFVTPGGLGLGAKQAEHSERLGPVIYYLTMVPESRGGGDLMPNNPSEYVFVGRWLGDRIAIVGDYSIDEDLPSFPNFGDVYKLCMEKMNPMYDCYGMKHKSKPRDSDNVWRDITSDLAIELESMLGETIIPLDHPTLWPDGMRKSTQLVEMQKNAKKIMKEQNP